MVPARLIRALLMLTAFAVVWLVAPSARAEGLSSVAPLLVSANSLFSHDDSEPVAPAPVTPEHGAPLCDIRGAITFAPPPQMQETEVSLDTGVTIDDCMSGNANGSRERSLSVSNGRSGPRLPQEIFSSSDAAVMTALAKLSRAPRELLPVPDASTTCLASGVRSTVDRPPRD